MRIAIKITNYLICILIVSIIFQTTAICIAKTSERSTNAVTKKFDSDFLKLDQKMLTVEKRKRLNDIKEQLALVNTRIPEKPADNSLVTFSETFLSENNTSEKQMISLNDIETRMDSANSDTEEISQEIAQESGEEEINEEEMKRFTPEPKWTSIAQSSSPSVKAEFVGSSTAAELNDSPEQEEGSFISISSEQSDYNAARKRILERNSIDDTKEFLHVVTRGETLGEIARMYGVDTASLCRENKIKEKDTIYVGQKLKVSAKGGILYSVQKGDSLWTIAKKYGLSVNKLVEDNNMKILETIKIGQKLYISVNQNYYTNRSSATEFTWPVKGRISSRFGARMHPVTKKATFHYGLDIAQSYGTSIAAAKAGKVFFAGWLRGYGRIVILKHSNGYMTKYAHCSALLVKKGQTVREGQIIAKLGNSGVSTGPHVHFEIVKNSERVNPLHFLK